MAKYVSGEPTHDCIDCGVRFADREGYKIIINGTPSHIACPGCFNSESTTVTTYQRAEYIDGTLQPIGPEYITRV